MKFPLIMRAIAIGLAILTPAGCATPPPANELISIDETQAAGRGLILSVLEMAPSPNAAYALQIDDAGITLSLFGTAAPSAPVVAGDEIRFGGYVIEVLPGPGRYRIDGRSYSFTAPGLYGFSRGDYVGRVQ